MRTRIRWAVGLIVLIHGLIHLMGVVEGFGWADVSQLAEPISTSMGVAWLVAAIVVVAAGVLLVAGVRGWWAAAAVAAVVSQGVIVTSWSDAKAGTAANVLLLIAAAYGFRAHGPTSFRARFRRLADETVGAVQASSGPGAAALVTDDDLEHLPSPVADYVRAVGAVGRPRVIGFHADISGRIRSGADQSWMPWIGQQVNTFGPAPTRVFFMDATMKGLPTDVLHAYVGPTATMQVRLASLVPIVNAHGPEMDQAETVTLLNDLCVLAPAALVDAPIDWTPIDHHHAQATFTNAGHTVSAVLVFNDDHELIDFVSDDRLASSRDGRSFTRQRWSTPIADYRSFDGRRVGALGAALWHPADEPSFEYLEFHADHISYLESGSVDRSRPTPSAAPGGGSAEEGALQRRTARHDRGCRSRRAVCWPTCRCS